MNLLNLVKDHLTKEVTSKLASAVGINDSLADNAMSSLLPGLLGGVIEKGSTEKGAGDIIGAITKYGLGDNVLGGLLGHIGGGKATDDFMGLGGNILSTVLGGKQNDLIDVIAGAAGLKKNNTSSLLRLLAPIALSVIGKKIKGDNLDALGLMRMLKGQKPSVFGAMPAALGAMYGGQEGEPVRATREATAERTTSGGGGWWKWLLPLLLLGALAWWLLTKGNKNKDQEDKDRTEDVITEDETTVDADVTIGDNDVVETVVIKALSVNADGDLVDADGNVIAKKDGFSIDANGNIVSPDGKILVRSGAFTGSVSGTSYSSLPTYTVDADGNLVDADGNIVIKAGDYKEVDGYYVDANGKRLSFISKVGKAIGDAATAVGNKFETVFTDLFTAKEKVGSSYSLSNISWDAEKHTISNFSKAEVEALASVLKQYPDAKMRVEVYADDADKGVSKLRANVVHDMLVALGVGDKQINFKGMGSKDATKAAAGAVDIVVEQTMN